jgi:hypothetical protein
MVYLAMKSIFPKKDFVKMVDVEFYNDLDDDASSSYSGKA